MTLSATNDQARKAESRTSEPRYQQPLEGAAVALSSLTPLAPRPPHSTVWTRRFPWSEGFDRIFRNEEVAGSNPASSTKHPGQGDMCGSTIALFFTIPPCAAPQPIHRIHTAKHLAENERSRVQITSGPPPNPPET
jgi:hypothetical protein